MTLKNKSKSLFPSSILAPLVEYLRSEERKLREKKLFLKKEDPFRPGKRVDEAAVDVDVAEQVDHERVSALKRQVSSALVSIRKTMTRVRLGKYGICEGCGKMIDTDRLAIDPTAAMCVKCKEKLESKKS